MTSRKVIELRSADDLHPGSGYHIWELYRENVRPRPMQAAKFMKTHSKPNRSFPKLGFRLLPPLQLNLRLIADSHGIVRAIAYTP